MTEQQVTTTPRKSVRDTIEGMKGQFAMALPRLLTADRFIRVALTCINKNPKLLLCTKESLLACLLDCAQLGIEPDGRRAHLIPYGNKCTLIIDYKGIAELVRRSGEISTLHVGIVYPDDEFEYQFGTGQFLKHKPSFERGEGKPIAVYSYVKLKDGQEDFDVMGIAEVERVRRRSRAANDGPWVTDFDEMAKKTVFRRHSKLLPLSPELHEKIEKDDEALTEQERFAAARPVGAVADIRFDEPQPAEPEPASEPNIMTGNPETHLDPNGVAVPPPEGDKPKRKRRTKAEMQAARQGGDANDSTSTDATLSGSGDIEAAPTSKPEAPPRAPLEKIHALLGDSPITEFQLEQNLIGRKVLLPHQHLAQLSDEMLGQIAKDFMKIASSIIDGQAPKSE